MPLKGQGEINNRDNFDVNAPRMTEADVELVRNEDVHPKKGQGTSATEQSNTDVDMRQIINNNPQGPNESDEKWWERIRPLFNQIAKDNSGQTNRDNIKK